MEGSRLVHLAGDLLAEVHQGKDRRSVVEEDLEMEEDQDSGQEDLLCDPQEVLDLVVRAG